MDDYGHGMLSDIRTNILLGTNYLNMVLNNAEGSQVLATAAYNAGPGRTRTWRGLLNARRWKARSSSRRFLSRKPATTCAT
jgi:soluble lytic murein transglycosylase